MLTNFAALTDEQKTVWSREFWAMARNNSFINQFAGRGHNAMVQRITELTKNEKGARAVLTLVNDLTGDGVTGDGELEGSEEELTSSDCVIQLDQLRNGNRLKGRMADQRTIVNFREQSRDKLAYWMADRMDQMAFLALAGIPFSYTNKGAQRYPSDPGPNKKLTDLEFASDITAPSTNRHRRWDATDGLVAGDTTAVSTADAICYDAIVELQAYARDQYIRGIRGSGGQEIYHTFLSPLGMAKLKRDPKFQENIRHAWNRGSKNPLFAGTSAVMVDGLVIHEYRHAFTTMNAQTGTSGEAGQDFYKWGANADVDGFRLTLCGAQALGMADIGNAYWEEEPFDYKNQKGISIGKIFGLLRPVLHSIYTGQKEDFGVVNCDFAMSVAT